MERKRENLLRVIPGPVGYDGENVRKMQEGKERILKEKRVVEVRKLGENDPTDYEEYKDP